MPGSINDDRIKLCKRRKEGAGMGEKAVFARGEKNGSRLGKGKRIGTEGLSALLPSPPPFPPPFFEERGCGNAGRRKEAKGVRDRIIDEHRWADRG